MRYLVGDKRYIQDRVGRNILCIIFGIYTDVDAFPDSLSEVISLLYLVPEFCCARIFVEYVGILFEPKMGNNGLWSVENVNWLVGMYL